MAKILIADDEANILKLIGGMLRKLGYIVIMASNGKDAYEKTVEEKPNMVILDRQMPEMDGFEVYKMIRETESIKDTHVVFVTAKDDEKEMLEILRDGAADYITKPFNMNELSERIETILSKHKIQAT